ncbi:Ff.00g062410.m01.CDS01 [Fusarium sp. VM40]|nr:Ff.00g062410.m01.CDS01 [Fusarium sp. VM40]
MPHKSSMIFIVSTSKDGPDPITRRVIRSHAMLGRNTRADRRRRAWERGNNTATSTDLPSSDSPSSSSRLDLGRSSEVDTSSFEETYMDERHGSALSIQGKIAPELSLARYDFEMKPYMIRLLQQALTTSKPCTYAVDLKLVQESEAQLFTLTDIITHKAAIHSILYTAQAFEELCLQVPISNLTRFHLGMTLYHLQQTLNEVHNATAMAVIAVIVNLASAASFVGDVEATVKHLEGLSQIFKMRGGITRVEAATMTELKALRIDICMSMVTGRSPRLLNEQTFQGLQAATSCLFKADPRNIDMLPPIDSKLALQRKQQFLQISSY